MNNFYTYLYRNPFTLEPIYVGKGKGDRAYDHLKLPPKTNPMLRNKIRAYRRRGQEPTIEFLCTNEDEEFVFLVEVEAIAKYGRIDLDTGTLCNFTDGGESTSGYKATKAVRKKWSEAKTGSKNPAFGKPGTTTGKTMSDEAKARVKAGCLARAARRKTEGLSPSWNSGIKTGKPSWNSGVKMKNTQMNSQTRGAADDKSAAY